MPQGDIRNIIGVNTMSPVVWTNRFGEGRVFCVTIGHGIDTLRRMDFLTMFVRGCEWAATGEVTLKRPDTSGENRFRKWLYY